MNEDDTTFNCQARYKGKSLGSGLRLEDAKHATGDFAAYRDLAAAYEKSSAARTLAVKKVRASAGVGGPLGKLMELTRPKADKKTTQQDNEYNRSVLRNIQSVDRTDPTFDFISMGVGVCCLVAFYYAIKQLYQKCSEKGSSC